MIWLSFINWIKRTYKFFEDIVYDLMWDKKDGPDAPMTFSLGRSAFIIWFIITCRLILNGAPADYLWYSIGFSLLGYTIGKQYIVTLQAPTPIEKQEHP